MVAAKKEKNRGGAARRGSPNRADLAARTAQFAQISPKLLSAVLSEAEAGTLDRWDVLCERMTSVDDEVRAAHESRVAALAGAGYQVQPGTLTGDPERDKYASAAAEFVSRVLANIGQERSALTHPYERTDFKSAVGALQGYGTSRGLAGIEIRWGLHEGAHVPLELWKTPTGRFRFRDACELELLVEGVPEPINRDQWIIYAPESVAGRITVIAGYRPVAWAYLFRRWGVQYWSQGAESFAWPVPVLKHPSTADDTKKDEYEALLEDLSQNKQAILEDSVALSLLETTIKDGGTWREFVAAMGRAIARCILGITDVSEPAKVGSFGSVESRQNTTVTPRIARDEEGMVAAITTQLIVPMLRFNLHLFGGKMPPIPRLWWRLDNHRDPLDANAQMAMTVDEVRATQGLGPLPEHGSKLWRDFIAESPGASLAPTEVQKQNVEDDTFSRLPPTHTEGNQAG